MMQPSQQRFLSFTPPQGWLWLLSATPPTSSQQRTLDLHPGSHFTAPHEEVHLLINDSGHLFDTGIVVSFAMCVLQ